jgi:LytS/YehU family sensor histidine kinase
MISSRDVPGANQYLADFSRLLRLFLTNSRSEFIHIGQEVETLQKYLTVEQARFGSMFDFDIVISQKLLDKMPEVAPSMVQPFLENSIMHGFCKKSAENKGLLTACFEPLDSGFVLCIIEDNGIGIAAGEIRTREHRKDHVSQGIKILEERLSLYNSMYNSDHKIRMEEVTPGAEEPGTRILLPVPINRNIKK